jgi:hypothetical protein
MSYKQNIEWLEAADEYFQEAIENLEWNHAHAICDDVDSRGFVVAAGEMRRKLNIARHEALLAEEEEAAMIEAGKPHNLQDMLDTYGG